MYVKRTNRRLEATRPSNDHHSRRNSRSKGRNTYECALCQRVNPLRMCRRFLNMSPGKREEAVERHHYCVNCLAKSHDLRACASLDTCRKCGKYHHTLLHRKPKRKGRPQRLETRNLPNRQNLTPSNSDKRERVPVPEKEHEQNQPSSRTSSGH